MKEDVVLGLIEKGQLYRLDVFQRRMQLGEAAMRQLRRAGLRTMTIGRRRYVLGSDVISHLVRQHPEE